MVSDLPSPFKSPCNCAGFVVATPLESMLVTIVATSYPETEVGEQPVELVEFGVANDGDNPKFPFFVPRK
jgi:hypothetical protein